jgi:PucR family transcriptional regulator, purine catabolism regulatory protein
MPFTAVVRAVADANEREEARLLGRVARLYELLRTPVIAGIPGAEMFRRLGEELGVRLFLVDPETGPSRFGDGDCTSFAAALMAGYASHENAIPGVLRLSMPQAAPGEPGALAVEVPRDQLPSLVLLHHIATSGALELAQLGAVQERQRRLGAELLSQLLDRRIDERAAAPLIADAGPDPAISVLAGTRAADDRAGPALQRRLTRAHVPHLLLDLDHMLNVLLPERRSLTQVSALPEPAVAVGCSDRVVATGRLPDARQEARRALGVAEAENRAVVKYGDQTTLLLPRNVTEAQALVAHPRNADHARCRARHRLLRCGPSCSTTGLGGWPPPSSTSTSRRWATGSGRSRTSPPANLPRPSTWPSSGSLSEPVTSSPARTRPRHRGPQSAHSSRPPDDSRCWQPT